MSANSVLVSSSLYIYYCLTFLPPSGPSNTTIRVTGDQEDLRNFATLLLMTPLPPLSSPSLNLLSVAFQT